MVIMAVDLGDSRTGIAVSDAGESFAFPREVICERSRERLVLAIATAAKKEKASCIVVGHPRNMDGSIGPKAQEYAALAERVAAAANLPVELWDERSTTVMAHARMNEQNIRGKQRRAVLDSEAAVILLEGFLAGKKG